MFTVKPLNTPYAHHHSMRLISAGALCATILLSSCASTSTNPSSNDWKAAQARVAGEGIPEPLRMSYSVLYADEARNRTLNWMRLGTEALKAGQYSHAKRAFTESIIFIDSLQAGNREAEQAKSKFKGEDSKPFKGEPYERVMAYFYRALLYYQDGEFDNAIAAAKSGFLQDSSSEGEKYQADFVGLEFLTCLSFQQLGRQSDAADAWSRAQKINPQLPKEMPSIKSNVLVVANYGDAPIKEGFGEYGEKLRFFEGHRTAEALGVPKGWVASSDILTYQATTRGGRKMDHVLAGKAVFKKGTDTAGDVLVVGGAVAAVHGLDSGNDATAIAGGAAVLAGIISKAISAATIAKADTRSWNNLPAAIFLSTGPIPPGAKGTDIEFLNKNESVVIKESINLNSPNTNKPNVIWIWK